jgi:hypothetical protein
MDDSFLVSLRGDKRLGGDSPTESRIAQALVDLGTPREQLFGKTCRQPNGPAEAGHCPIIDLGQVLDNSERVLLRSNNAH